MKAKELREKADDDLQLELEGLREKLFRLRFQKVTDVVENPSEFQRHRRDIARILTILRERQNTAPAKKEGNAEKKA